MSWRKQIKGQSAVEFVLVFSCFVILLICLTQLITFLYSKVSLDNKINIVLDSISVPDLQESPDPNSEIKKALVARGVSTDIGILNTIITPRIYTATSTTALNATPDPVTGANVYPTSNYQTITVSFDYELPINTSLIPNGVLPSYKGKAVHSVINRWELGVQ